MQLHQPSELWRDLARESLSEEIQLFQADQHPEFGRERPREKTPRTRGVQRIVVADGKDQPLETDQAAKLGWEWAGQLISGEPEGGQVDEFAKLRRQGPGQFVHAEGKRFKIGQVAEFRWNAPHQSVAAPLQVGPCIGERARREISYNVSVDSVRAAANGVRQPGAQVVAFGLAQ